MQHFADCFQGDRLFYHLENISKGKTLLDFKMTENKAKYRSEIQQVRIPPYVPLPVQGSFFVVADTS